MHEELIPVISRLEQAVAERNADEIISALARLSETFIYSGNEVYDRFRAIETEMIAVLFETIDLVEFCQLFLDSHNQKIYPSGIWSALETIADRISFAALWFLKDYYGFPRLYWAPKLYAVLADEPDVKISEELIDGIDRLTHHEAREGINFCAHEARMANFRYIRWAPEDGGLSDMLRLLGNRRDPVARAACEKYLLELPWGTDRGGTAALLDGMSDRRAEENVDVFKHALSIHKKPLMLRMWIWRALFYGDPTEAVVGVMEDFRVYRKSEDLMLLIDFLGGLLQHLQTEKKDYDEEHVIAAAEKVDTAKWSFVVRGYYGTMLRVLLPKADYGRKSGPIGRGFVAVARVWNWIQIDHMGCAGPLLLMIGVMLFFLWGLDFLLGAPSKESLHLPRMLFMVWIAWAVINVQTHFSGHKSIVQKFFAVAIYFGTLFSAIAASIIIRL